jgi:hypothetical protein
MTHKFKVTKSFEATEPISGRKRILEPGEMVLCDTGQKGRTILVEIDKQSLLAETTSFKACCILMNEGAPFF